MSVEHLIYIPGLLLMGVALGFRLGAGAARSELAKRKKERQQ